MVGVWGVGGERNRRGITTSATGRENGGKSMNETGGTGVGGEGTIAETITTTVGLVQCIARPGITAATATAIWTETRALKGIETATMVERKTSRRGGESEGESGRVLGRKSGRT
jgi:hypothetical protein